MSIAGTALINPFVVRRGGVRVESHWSRLNSAPPNDAELVRFKGL
jgi:hypothetical protein